jgi:hypothetical protein
MPSRRGSSGGLRERERQIASAVAVVAVVAVAAVVFVVVVDNGVDVNGCVASASAPVVHVLPGQWRRRRTSRGGWRRSNPKVVELTTHAGMRRLYRVEYRVTF